MAMIFPKKRGVPTDRCDLSCAQWWAAWSNVDSINKRRRLRQGR